MDITWLVENLIIVYSYGHDGGLGLRLIDGPDVKLSSFGLAPDACFLAEPTVAQLEVFFFFISS